MNRRFSYERRLTLRQAPAKDGLAGGGAARGRGSTLPELDVDAEILHTDLSDQFTVMIQTQQAYSANTKVVTASNEMLQTLTNMTL